MLSSLAPSVLRQGCLFAILLCALPLCVFAETKVSVRFSNAMKDDRHITMFWRNPVDREEMSVTSRFSRGVSEVVEAYTGHVFVAYDDDRQDFREFYIEEPKAGESVIDIVVTDLIRKTAIARFINHSPGSMELFWKNEETGEDIRVGPFIKKGHFFDLDTHKGHVFVAKNLRGEVLEEFTVNSVPGVREEHTIGEKPVAVFKNMMKKPTSIFWFDTDSNEEVEVHETLQPGASHEVFAHPGHKFIIKDHMKRRIKEFTVSADYGKKETCYVEL